MSLSEAQTKAERARDAAHELAAILHRIKHQNLRPAAIALELQRADIELTSLEGFTRRARELLNPLREAAKAACPSPEPTVAHLPFRPRVVVDQSTDEPQGAA